MKAQSTSKGAAALSIANIVVKLLSLLYVPVLIDILTRPGHGTYSFAYEIFVFAYIVLTEGFARGVTKLVSELETSKEESRILTSFREALKIMFVLGGITALLIFIFAPQIAEMGNSPASYLAIRALAPALLTTSLVSVYRGYFQGRMYMKPYAYSQVIEHIFNVSLSLLFAYYFETRFYTPEHTYSVFGGAFGTTVASLISLLFLMYVYKYKDTTKDGVAPIADSSERKEIISILKQYSVPLTLGALFQQLGNLVDVFNVKNRLFVSEVTAMNAGIAGVLDKINTENLNSEGIVKLIESRANAQFSMLSTYKTMIGVPIGLVVALTMAILPALARHYANRDYNNLSKDYNTSMKVGLLFVMPASFGLMGSAFEITRALYPDVFKVEYMSAMVLFVGALATILMSVSLIQTVALQSTGYYKDSLKPLILGVVVKVILNYFLVAIPAIQIYGAVISTYIAYIVTVIYSEYLIKNKLKVHVSVKEYIGKLVSASIVMFIVLMGIHFLTYGLNLSRLPASILLVFQIIFGAAVYVYVIIRNGAVRKSDIMALSPRIADRIPGKIMRIMKD